MGRGGVNRSEWIAELNARIRRSPSGISWGSAFCNRGGQEKCRNSIWTGKDPP